jgi:hypothetical protein
MELAQTALMEIPLDECSAKIRTGPPVDEDADYELANWAGLIPFETTMGTPQDDPKIKKGTALPSYLKDNKKK